MTVNLPVVITEISKVLHSDEVQRQMKSMLPPSVGVDRFTEVTIAAIQNNPDVLEADRDSLYRACLSAARRGLLPDKREGALVIYNTKVSTNPDRWMKLVQFLPMVEGVIKEMAKAGINAYAVSVYENDKISFWNDDQGQHVQHEPVVFGDRGKIVGFFAAAITEERRPYVEPMALQDVAQVARRSKQCRVDEKTGEIQYGGTWRTDFDRMGQKSCLHRLRKRLPITDEDALQNLKDLEEQTDTDLNPGAGTVAPRTETPTEAGSSGPPPTQALPAPDNSQDEVLRPVVGSQAQHVQTGGRVRTPRKSRVLQGVTETLKAQNGAGAQAAPKPTPSPQPPPQEEYSEDDIV